MYTLLEKKNTETTKNYQIKNNEQNKENAPVNGAEFIT